MDATTWKRAGWLTAGTRMVEVDGVAVQVCPHTNGLHVQHGGMAYRITTTTAPTGAGCRTSWLCPVCGARCNRLGMAGLMLGCGACRKLAKRTTPPPESRAINTRHIAHQRKQAGLELARVVSDWVTASTNERTKKQRNERGIVLRRRVSVAHARVRGPMLRWSWPAWCGAGQEPDGWSWLVTQ